LGSESCPGSSSVPPPPRSAEPLVLGSFAASRRSVVDRRRRARGEGGPRGSRSRCPGGRSDAFAEHSRGPGHPHRGSRASGHLRGGRGTRRGPRGRIPAVPLHHRLLCGRCDQGPDPVARASRVKAPALGAAPLARGERSGRVPA
jgi:hypothetical protein